MPREGPVRGWRVAGRVSEAVSEFVWGARAAGRVGGTLRVAGRAREGVSVFVWGARDVENVGCFAWRASLTLMPTAHADRASLVATAYTLTLPLTQPARRDPFSRAFCNFPTRPSWEVSRKPGGGENALFGKDSNP